MPFGAYCHFYCRLCSGLKVNRIPELLAPGAAPRRPHLAQVGEDPRVGLQVEGSAELVSRGSGGCGGILRVAGEVVDVQLQLFDVGAEDARDFDAAVLSPDENKSSCW